MKRYLGLFINHIITKIVLLIVISVITGILISKGIYQLAVIFAFMDIWLGSMVYHKYKMTMHKVEFMFDAIDNSDYSFKYATESIGHNDKIFNESLNRITQIIFQAKEEAKQREKYYELIINSVDTGILVIDSKGNILQSNKAALNLLGMELLTHVSQLNRINNTIQQTFLTIPLNEKKSVDINGKKGEMHLAVQVTGMKLNNEVVRIFAISDINSELEEKELDSWIRITRVLTHEIMNSVTPITSLSDTLLLKCDSSVPEIKEGLSTISKTGKGLIDFVENYRKFTHIPTPHPELFYLKPFLERMRNLSLHQQIDTSNQSPLNDNNFGNTNCSINIEINVSPEDLLVYADENLISRVVLNLIKNAMQAIGSERSDGKVEIKSWCDSSDAIYIEISNNGPLIPAEEMEHIFVPFFTTKEGGSGIGLSLSRQIMRVSGGNLTLRSDKEHQLTIFTIKFP